MKSKHLNFWKLNLKNNIQLEKFRNDGPMLHQFHLQEALHNEHIRLFNHSRESLLSSASVVDRMLEEGWCGNPLEIPSCSIYSARSHPFVRPRWEGKVERRREYKRSGVRRPFSRWYGQSSIDFVEGIKRRFVSLSHDQDEFACRSRKLARPILPHDSSATAEQLWHRDSSFQDSPFSLRHWGNKRSGKWQISWQD